MKNSDLRSRIKHQERIRQMMKIQVLLIEDNHGDVLLLKEAFAEAELELHLTIAHDGLEAMHRLYPGEGQPSPKPELILLDLNLPQLSGKDVLARIKADPVLATVPLMIITSSRSDYDLIERFGVPPDWYLVKPNTFREYVDIARKIGEFLSGQKNNAREIKKL
jgi:two-component system, chemotaxis family, response regulator Rcp1